MNRNKRGYYKDKVIKRIIQSWCHSLSMPVKFSICSLVCSLFPYNFPGSMRAESPGKYEKQPWKFTCECTSYLPPKSWGFSMVQESGYFRIYNLIGPIPLKLIQIGSFSHKNIFRPKSSNFDQNLSKPYYHNQNIP